MASTHPTKASKPHPLASKPWLLFLVTVHQLVAYTQKKSQSLVAVVLRCGSHIQFTPLFWLCTLPLPWVTSSSSRSTPPSGSLTSPPSPATHLDPTSSYQLLLPCLWPLSSNPPFPDFRSLPSLWRLLGLLLPTQVLFLSSASPTDGEDSGGFCVQRQKGGAGATPSCTTSCPKFSESPIFSIKYSLLPSDKLKINVLRDCSPETYMLLLEPAHFFD